MEEEKSYGQTPPPAEDAKAESPAPETHAPAQGPEEPAGGPAQAAPVSGPDSDRMDLFDWLQCAVTALVACILIFVFVARNCGVVGQSMEDTLEDGEQLIISRLFYTPSQGDIVVLRKASFRQDPIVKRIIALEGQTVDIDFEEGAVYVDGVKLQEDYIKDLTHRALDFDGEITVPEGCVFVMGDNRNQSNDSRDSRIGCVDTRCIIGKALWRIAPLSRFGSLY